MNLIKKLSTRSPWLFRINAGSCNGCDVELATTRFILYFIFTNLQNSL